MSLLRTTRWLLLAALTATAIAQDASPSLGDVARKSRKARVGVTPVATQDEDGPDAGGVWRVKQCMPQSCYSISLTLPKSPKWTRSRIEPRPVSIPLAGHDDGSVHAIRVYAAESIIRDRFEGTHTFLQGWFARPEYFGQAAKFQLKRPLIIDGRSAIITNFTVNSGSQKYRGVSVIASAPASDFGFACVFLEEDSAAAASICDALIASAAIQTLEPARPQYYPGYQPPPEYYYPPPRRQDDDEDQD